jgi:hypothetical protein
VRVERTIDIARCQSPVLKTGRVTGPPSLPHRTVSPTALAHEPIRTLTIGYGLVNKSAAVKPYIVIPSRRQPARNLLFPILRAAP